MSSIKKNLFYNLCYQILTLILPFITVPYVSRTLGADGVGIYSYTYSIVNYFMLFAMLGINNHGNRTIAKVRDNKKKLSEKFWSIYIIQLSSTLLMIVIYILYIIFIVKEYKIISIIQIIYLLSTLFDINWLFFGLEKFKITVTRNALLKTLSLILIILLVKNKDDIWLYTLILSGSTLVSQLLLIPFFIKELEFIPVKRTEIKKNIKPCLVLFIPVIAISLYNIMDKIMLGLLSNVSEVGYYEQASKIIYIPLGLVTALGTVMLPRISNLVANKNIKAIKKYLKKSVDFMMFLAIPIYLGLIAISEDFVPLFLGKEFFKSSKLVCILSVNIIFMSFANIIRTQYLIPNERDKTYIISVSLGALINLIINFLLIPKLASVGACIGTIIAEFTVMFYQVISVRKELPIKKYIRAMINYLWKGCIMFLVVILIKCLHLNSLITITLQITVGILLYFLMNIRYLLTIINLNKIKSKIIKD